MYTRMINESDVEVGAVRINMCLIARARANSMALALRCSSHSAAPLRFSPDLSLEIDKALGSEEYP